MIFVQNIVKLSVGITFNIKLFGKGLIQIKFIYINAIPIHISTKKYTNYLHGIGIHNWNSRWFSRSFLMLGRCRRVSWNGFRCCCFIYLILAVRNNSNVILRVIRLKLMSSVVRFNATRKTINILHKSVLFHPKKL